MASSAARLAAPAAAHARISSDASPCSSAAPVTRAGRASAVDRTREWRSFCTGVRVLKSEAGRPAQTERRKGLRIEAAKRISTGKSLVLSATLVVEEGNEAQVQKLCDGVLAWAEERKKDKKLGVIHFECSSDAYDKNVFHFWERYDTFASMNDTRASPEHSAFMNEVRPLLKEPVALAAYEYKDGKIGCMLNPIGPKGEGGLDDATGQGGSGGGASYKQTSSGVRQGINDSSEENVWGLERALELSSPKAAAAAAANAREAAVGAAAKIAEGLANLFGTNKRKSG